jgi:hypothetical protein
MAFWYGVAVYSGRGLDKQMVSWAKLFIEKMFKKMFIVYLYVTAGKSLNYLYKYEHYQVHQ